MSPQSVTVCGPAGTFPLTAIVKIIFVRCVFRPALDTATGPEIPVEDATACWFPLKARVKKVGGKDMLTVSPQLRAVEVVKLTITLRFEAVMRSALAINSVVAVTAPPMAAKNCQNQRLETEERLNKIANLGNCPCRC